MRCLFRQVSSSSPSCTAEHVTTQLLRHNTNSYFPCTCSLLFGTSSFETALSKLKQKVHTLDAEEGEMFPECSTALATFGH